MLNDKLGAMIEIFLAEIFFFVMAWYLQAINRMSYGWYSKIIMIILGFIGILIHRKRSRNYTLLPRNIAFSIKWSIYTLVLFTVVDLITLLIFSSIVSRIKIDLKMLVIDLVWFFIFVGFAEELFFRGYSQPRLNEVFTEKYKKILGIEYEWSKGTLIVAVLFFGIPHILTGVNPFTGRTNINPLIVMVTLFACFLGVLFGVLREKTGGIVLPTILHALIDFTVYGIGRITGIIFSNFAAGISIFLFLAIFFDKILKEKI